jgi:hypothetical protein
MDGAGKSLSLLNLHTDVGKATEHMVDRLMARNRYPGMVIKSSLCI